MFPPARILYQKLRQFGEVASEVYQDLVGIHFIKNSNSPDENALYPKKSLGYAIQGSNTGVSANRGLALGGYQPSTGTAGLYAAWGQYVWLTGAGAPTKQSGLAAQVLTTNTDGEFEQANDDLIYANGLDGTLKLSGGTWAAAGAAEPLGTAGTIAKYLLWHNFMLFAARTVNAPNKLSVSDAGLPYTFSGNTKTFPYKIVGLKGLGEYAVVYTEKTIHTIMGSVPSALSFREVPNAHPCVSHRSIVTTIRRDAQYSSTGLQSGLLEHWYLGPDYVWAFNGSTFRILGKESWESYRANLNTSQLALAAATLDTTTGQYWLSVPTGANTANNATWAYDPLADVWVEKPYFSAAAWARYGVPTPDTYFLESSAVGKVFKSNSGHLLSMPTTTVNGAHTAAVTTVTVASTTGFPTSGYFFNSTTNESVYYSGLSGTTFTGCVRGSSGTLAAAMSTSDVITVANKYRYRTRHMDLNEPNLQKKFQVLWVNPKVSTVQQGLSISLNVDQYGQTTAATVPLKSSGTTWNSFTWGSSNWGAPSVILTPTNRAALSGRGGTIQVGLEENASIQQTEVYDARLKFRPLKIK